ncbi:DUF3237 domain-containing protein [Noviherbaspirillum cavernae]|uniref:DUF3237 domain-containing protein n=1 Tax=Noviherbaspirillum cavernae TaxID=2320862 RepID=A0A418X4I7_9BURK|nr:DUF3237 family protein [Noviherbaspirillum cavernae]RJG07374.1 DUF3237 domain-containing protein [Noviherbaspirillum cavernae]
MSDILENPAALRPVIRVEVHVAPPTMLGELAGVERRIIAIAGGTIAGADFAGTILPGGSDIQSVRADGTIELTARYAVDLGPHGKLLVENTGIRRNATGLEAQSAPPYFRGVMRFNAPAGPLQWLNDSVFISSGRREGGTVFLDVFEVV